MRDYLLATITDEERALAAGLLEDPKADLRSAIIEIFKSFDDPLLSPSDVVELVGGVDRQEEIGAALAALEAEHMLEVSPDTQRPFDTTPCLLYRIHEVAPAGRLVITVLESQSFDGASRYQFSIEGRIIRSLARVDRLDAIAGSGNQRKEIEAHVRRIAEGVRSGTNVPTPVLLVLIEEATATSTDPEAFEGVPESSVKVSPLEDWVETTTSDGGVLQRQRLVSLDFPFRKAAFDEEKSVLLVDGQQRTAALSLISISERPHIDLGVSAVISTEEDAKRVFQVANETVKISTDFSRALLASMATAPGYLRSERTKAEACRLLVLSDSESPFFELVRYPGAKISGAVVAYNSLFSVVSTFAAGLPDDLVEKPEALASIVKRAFNVVKATWTESWGLKPGESRLMHGAGLRSMAGVCLGKVQSYLQNGLKLTDDALWSELSQSMSRLSHVIVWRDADAAKGTKTAKTYWREEISYRQNTSQDIKTLTDFIAKESLALDVKAKTAK